MITATEAYLIALVFLFLGIIAGILIAEILRNRNERSKSHGWRY